MRRYGAHIERSDGYGEFLRFHGCAAYALETAVAAADAEGQKKLLLTAIEELQRTADLFQRRADLIPTAAPGAPAAVSAIVSDE